MAAVKVSKMELRLVTSSASKKLLKQSKIARHMLSREASPKVLEVASKMAVETVSNMACHLVPSRLTAIALNT